MTFSSRSLSSFARLVWDEDSPNIELTFSWRSLSSFSTLWSSDFTPSRQWSPKSDNWIASFPTWNWNLKHPLLESNSPQTCSNQDADITTVTKTLGFLYHSDPSNTIYSTANSMTVYSTTNSSKNQQRQRLHGHESVQTRTQATLIHPFSRGILQVMAAVSSCCNSWKSGNTFTIQANVSSISGETNSYGADSLLLMVAFIRNTGLHYFLPTPEVSGNNSPGACPTEQSYRMPVTIILALRLFVERSPACMKIVHDNHLAQSH